MTSSFVILAVVLSLSFHSGSARAEIPVKARAFLTIAGYGTAGGALLGLASMAFGNSTRAVAQGASLGLYAGLIFGTYVLVSHHQRQAGYYEDNTSPYQNSSDVYGDGYNQGDGGSGQSEDKDRGFFDRFQQLQEHVHQQSFTFDSQKRKGGNLPPLYLNLLQYNF